MPTVTVTRQAHRCNRGIPLDRLWSGFMLARVSEGSGEGLKDEVPAAEQVLLERLPGGSGFYDLMTERSGAPSDTQDADEQAQTGELLRRILDLRRLMFVETVASTEWEKLSRTDPGLVDPRGLRRLIVSELSTRLPRDRNTADHVDSELVELLESSADSFCRDTAGLLRRALAVRAPEIDAACHVRHILLRGVWQLFISDAFLGDSVTVLEHSDTQDGRYVQTIEFPLARRERIIEKLRVPRVSRRRGTGWSNLWRKLHEVQGGRAEVLANAIFLDLSVEPAQAFKLLVDTAVPDPKKKDKETQELFDDILPAPGRVDPADLAIDRHQMQALTEGIGRFLSEVVPAISAANTAVTNANARRGLALTLERVTRNEQTALMKSHGITDPTLNRARSDRQRLLSPYGLIRGQRIEDDERLGTMHVLPDCLDSAFPTKVAELAAARASEWKLDAAMAAVAAGWPGAIAQLDKALQDAHATRRAIRAALPRASRLLLFERGLVGRPREIPEELWRAENQGQKRGAPRKEPAEYACESGRVIVAPTDREFAFPVTGAIIETYRPQLVAASSARLDQPTLEAAERALSASASGEWYYFCQGGVDV